MRKLTITEHISLDGVIQHSADDDGRSAWRTWREYGDHDVWPFVKGHDFE